MIADSPQFSSDAFAVQRGNDDAVVVRIASRRDVPSPLPDAVFTFREGDPQYDYWKRRLAESESN
jgi:hypothetical protein